MVSERDMSAWRCLLRILEYEDGEVLIEEEREEEREVEEEEEEEEGEEVEV